MLHHCCAHQLDTALLLRIVGRQLQSWARPAIAQPSLQCLPVRFANDHSAASCSCCALFQCCMGIFAACLNAAAIVGHRARIKAASITCCYRMVSCLYNSFAACWLWSTSKWNDLYVNCIHCSSLQCSPSAAHHDIYILTYVEKIVKTCALTHLV